MIREVTMYQALCDRCRTHDKDSDYAGWSSPEDAMLQAKEDGFLVGVKDRFVCADCWTWSEDEDEMIESPPLSVGTETDG